MERTQKPHQFGKAEQLHNQTIEPSGTRAKARFGETVASKKTDKTEHFSFGNVVDDAPSIWSIQGKQLGVEGNKEYMEEYGDYQLPSSRRKAGP